MVRTPFPHVRYGLRFRGSGFGLGASYKLKRHKYRDKVGSGDHLGRAADSFCPLRGVESRRFNCTCRPTSFDEY